MILSNNPQPGDIWLAYLHFLDKPNIGKVRPILVLIVDERCIALVLKITSNVELDESIAFPIENWEKCGLRKPSVVRLDQLFEITHEDLLGEERLGSISADQLDQIKKYLGIN